MKYCSVAIFSERNLDNKRLLHDIFHIGSGISPRLPYQAPNGNESVFLPPSFLAFLYHRKDLTRFDYIRNTTGWL
jgi:hypothetical protein